MSSRDREHAPRRFIAIPFASGCRSQSSVDVVHTAARKKHHQQGGSGGSELAAGKPAAASGKGGESLVARLLRGFKNLSQIFAVYDDDDEEEEEREMVIGLPTDVKHVAHIGWDGSTNTTTSLRSWNRAAPPPPADSAAAASTSSASAAAASAASTSSAPALQQQQQHPQQALAPPPTPPLPALSMRQFELAMAAQAAAGAAPDHRRHS